MVFKGDQLESTFPDALKNPFFKQESVRVGHQGESCDLRGEFLQDLIAPATHDRHLPPEAQQQTKTNHRSASLPLQEIDLVLHRILSALIDEPKEFGKCQADRKLLGDDNAVVDSIHLGILVVKQYKVPDIETEKTSSVLYGIFKLISIGQPSSAQSLGVNSIETPQAESTGKAGMNIFIKEKKDFHLGDATLGWMNARFFQCSTSVDDFKSWSISS